MLKFTSGHGSMMIAAGLLQFENAALDHGFELSMAPSIR
jgi:hypothetical protein